MEIIDLKFVRKPYATSYAGHDKKGEQLSSVKKKKKYADNFELTTRQQFQNMGLYFITCTFHLQQFIIIQCRMVVLNTAAV